MLKRKITQILLDWKTHKHNEVLLVKGARQVGKTYIIDKFGKENYEKYFYLNFYENKQLKNVFEGNLNTKEIFSRLSLYFPDFNIVPKKTLIFIDEIQECPNARTALKFLALENDIDVIASGSLLGIMYKDVASIPVGYEKQITLQPLDFEEYLWAIGINEDAIDYFKNLFKSMTRVENGINNTMLAHLRTYMVVGGMPEVVSVYAQTKNFQAVQDAQDKILDAYKLDMLKYAETFEKPKIRRCYDSIPNQLAKENKKFQYKVVESGSTSRKYADSLQWLVDANLITICYNVSNPQLPLAGYARNDYFKIYLNDIGLLVAMYGYKTKEAILTNGIKDDVKGGIYENLIADILSKKGYKLYFYKPDEYMEIEFLIEQNLDVIPVEVKAGNQRTQSLNKFMEKFDSPYSYKMITGNLGQIDRKITLPLYMAMFL